MRYILKKSHNYDLEIGEFAKTYFDDDYNPYAEGDELIVDMPKVESDLEMMKMYSLNDRIEILERKVEILKEKFILIDNLVLETNKKIRHELSELKRQINDL